MSEQAEVASRDIYDPMDPDTLRDPYEVYGRIRRDTPVVRGERFGGFWMLSRHADVCAAAMDTATFQSGQGVTLPPFGNPMPFIPQEIDPPLHAAYRRPLHGWFTRRKMAELEPDVRRIVTEQIDRFIDRGEADFAKELAEPVPPLALAQVFGLPAADCPYFTGLGQTIVDAGDREDIETAMVAIGELTQYLGEQAERRRADPTDDMLTAIVQMEVNGKRLSDEEVLGAALFLVQAGHETSVGGLGMMLLHIGQRPEIRAQLMADRSLIPAAVEESLRFDAPIQTLSRVVGEDTCVRDVDLRAGDRVMLCFGSANRDEEVFPHPDEMDLHRPKNPHVAFGYGVHRCLGAPLARLEMQLVLEEVLRRIPDYEVDASSVEVGGFLARHVRRMRVTW